MKSFGGERLQEGLRCPSRQWKNGDGDTAVKMRQCNDVVVVMDFFLMPSRFSVGAGAEITDPDLAHQILSPVKVRQS